MSDRREDAEPLPELVDDDDEEVADDELVVAELCVWVVHVDEDDLDDVQLAEHELEHEYVEQLERDERGDEKWLAMSDLWFVLKNEWYLKAVADENADGIIDLDKSTKSLVFVFPLFMFLLVDM